jgi:hypothetical protein
MHGVAKARSSQAHNDTEEKLREQFVEGSLVFIERT